MRLIRILLLAMISFSGMHAKAQTGNVNVPSTELKSEWKLVYSNSGVNIYTRTEECQVQNGYKPLGFVFLKIENVSGENKTVDFDLISHYTEGCDGCNNANGEASRKFIIPANSSIQQDCNGTYNQLQRIISNTNYTGSWHFTSLEISHINIQ